MVIDAAVLVGLHETIMRLPEGYDTDIGEAGSRLSGGQKQRLGLARAFFGDPKVVVLDEPNASLDMEGELALQQAIGTMRDRGTTVIIIAQRLGVLAVADKILVLSQGSIDTIGERSQVVGMIKSGKTALRSGRLRCRRASGAIPSGSMKPLPRSGRLSASSRSLGTTPTAASPKPVAQERVMKSLRRHHCSGLIEALADVPPTPAQRLRGPMLAAVGMVGISLSASALGLGMLRSRVLPSPQAPSRWKAAARPCSISKAGSLATSSFAMATR